MFLIGELFTCHTNVLWFFSANVAINAKPLLLLIVVPVVIDVARGLLRPESPNVFCKKNGKLHRIVRNKLTNLKYQPVVSYLPVLKSSFMQSILPNLIRGLSPYMNIHRRQYIELDDGGLVSLDWYDAVDDSKPILLFVPGAHGDSQASYIRVLAPMAQKLSINCATFNYRGRARMPLKTPKLYCAACCDDLAVAIDVIKSQHANSQLIVAGFSLGAIMLTKYLVKSGSQAKVAAALMVSMPFDIIALDKSLHSMRNFGLNYITNKLLTMKLVAIVTTHADVFAKCSKINYDQVINSRSVKEFDENFNVKIFGFESTEDYYRESSNYDNLDKIKVPTIYLTAKDDYFVPFNSVPTTHIRNCDNVALVATNKGGHLGFMDTLVGQFYLERFFVAFLNSFAECNKSPT